MTGGPPQLEEAEETSARTLLEIRGEMILVLSLFLSGILLYYSRRQPWTTIGVVVVTAAAVCLAYSLRFVNPTTLGDLNVTRKRAGIYALAGALLIIPGYLFDSLYSYLTGRGWIPLALVSSPSLILSILVVAVSEESFFRGYLQGRLKQIGSHRWIRIPLVCALFMFYKVLIHSWEGWTFALYVEFFAIGALKMLFETWWVDWTGSIVTPIVIHIGWDLIMFQGYAGPPYWAL